jgi:RHS repeat-associated protein
LQPDQLFIADFDGDGMQDIMVVDAKGFNIYKNKGGNESSSFTSINSANSFSWSTTFSSNYILKMGDFNGDGLPDFLLHLKGTSKWYLAKNSGDMTFTSTLMPVITAEDDPDTGKDDDKDDCLVYDFDNDGKTDVVTTDAHYKWKHSWGSSWKVFDKLTVSWYKSTGDGFQLIKTAQSGNENDAYSKYFVTGDFNGDGRVELMNYGFDCYGGTSTAQQWRIYGLKDISTQSGQVTAIANGYNQKVSFNYELLTNPGVYSKVTTPAYPLSTITQPLLVTESIKTDNGIGGQTAESYRYTDATIHKQGKGFLGFAKITQTNLVTNKIVNTVSVFDNNYFGLSKQTIATYSGTTQTEVQTSDYTYTSLGGKRICLGSLKTTVSDLLKGNTKISTSVYDKDGNLSQQNDAYNTDFYVSKNLYSSYDAHGNPGVITSSLQRKGENAMVHSQSMTYDLYGQLMSSLSYGITTEYTYDAYGNPLSTVSSATGLDSRRVTMTYDATGRFIQTKTNALGHSEKSSYDDSGFGWLSNTVNANGGKTSYSYDAWGIATKKVTPDDKTYTYGLKWVNSGAANIPDNALFYSEIYKDGLFAGVEYFDKLNRSLRRISTGYNGARYFSDTKYDVKGQVTEVTEPYPAGETASKKTVNTYDAIGRIQTETLSNGVIKTYGYNGNTISTTLSTGEAYSKTYDATGQVISSTDPGGTITYSYNSGNKATTIKSPGSTVTMTYDPVTLLQKTLTDPNAGTTTYGYNAFGELTSQTDLREKKTVMAYDKLGRVVTKTVDGTPFSYSYDGSDRTLGTVKEITGNGVTFGYTYSSDGLCRLFSETRSKGTESLMFSYEYDKKGRVSKRTYPSGFATTNSYTDYDDLKAIYQVGNSTPIWQLNSVNSKGQLEKVTYGNNKQLTYGYDTNDRLNHLYADGIVDFNYQFNDKQQLNYRDEKFYKGSTWQGLREDFTYDNVNRLSTATISGIATPPAPLVMTYGIANDRIVQKSDAGSFSYQTGGHRLDQMVSVPDYHPVDRHITYTAEGKINTLTEGNKLLTFGYGLDNKRFSMEYKQADVVQYTKYYFNDYEKQIKADGTIRQLNYIYEGGGLVAMYEQNATGEALHYVYTDYQGSLRCITDATGNVEQRLGFDAWGNRRDPFTGIKLTSTETASLLFARGYTGHEHLDEFVLINMNGRVYDPMIGMFLSPDNAVQAPDFTQSFNRFAYCVNNPLMFGDPTGYTWLSHLTGWIGEQLSSVDPTMDGTITNKGFAAAIKIGMWGPNFIPSTIDFIGNGGDFSRYDPFYKGTISNNSARITMGLFTGSHQQILSRFTWELPQTILGYGYSQGGNYFGTVKSVSYYDGATVVQNYKDHVWLGPGTGITFGSYINGSNEIKADPNNSLFQHEYGHYLQSQASGWGYLPRYALPSLWGDGNHNHDFNPVEQDANVRAFNYFNKTVPDFYDKIAYGDHHGWDFRSNPIDPNHTYSRSIYWDYNSSSDMDLVNGLKIGTSWYDYAAWVWLPFVLQAGRIHSN